MKFLVLNGPNINMIGIREKNIYGTMDYQSILAMIQKEADERKVEVIFKQSNHEGDLVDAIQQAYFDHLEGIIINPAAYTHTSVAILDAIKAIAPLPVVEVHLSDIQSRDEFRKLSYSSLGCIQQIAGHGPQGYIMALDVLIQKVKEQA